LSTTAVLPDQLWTQDSAGLVTGPNRTEAGDYFGWALSSGDYNGDGRDDLAIGVPFEDIQNGPFQLARDAGLVHIIYGSSGGLSTTVLPAPQIFAQFSFQTHIRDSTNLGRSLSSGDYNGDGKDDLTIGINGAPFHPRHSGAVYTIYGSPVGLSPHPSNPNTVIGFQVWTQNSDNIDDVAEDFDEFGVSLASGDFNGDNNDDLVVGVPEEGHPNSGTAAGLVHVIYGSSGGLSAIAVLPDQLFIQGMSGLDDVAEANDFFGWGLAPGDYNGDSKDDLAIGASFESISSETILNVGKVHVIYGSSAGLSTSLPIPDQLWQQGVNGVDDIAEAGDLFGDSLSSGDYNGDGNDDLAIGVSEEKIAGESILVGKVHVIYGSSSGLSTSLPIPDQLWQQGVNGLDEVAEQFDRFGRSVSSGDYNGDSKDDLAVGSPGESIASETINRAGKLHIVYGSSLGLSTTSPIPDQLWQQGVNGLDGIAEAGDQFSRVL
jgi:hypothetical protein